MPRPRSRFLITEWHSAPESEHDNFETVTPGKRPRFNLIAVAEKQASVFACPGSRLYVFRNAEEKGAWGEDFLNRVCHHCRFLRTCRAHPPAACGN